MRELSFLEWFDANADLQWRGLPFADLSSAIKSPIPAFVPDVSREAWINEVFR